MKDVFAQRKLLIVTKHEKEIVIAPLLESALEVEAVTLPDFDTDQFGTFTREVKRPGDMLETARRKLNVGLDQAGLDLGVASEGSFGPHPSHPLLTSNFELILLIDRLNNYEIRGHYRTNQTNFAGLRVDSVSAALAFATKIGFPNHGLIVRASEHSNRLIKKNITDEASLIRTVEKMLQSPFRRHIFLETDMRADQNPTRMQAIAAAAENLIQNLASPCPECSAPGFMITDLKRGQPCRWCQRPTDQPQAEIWSCASCHHQQSKDLEASADPKYCDHCNA